MFLHESVKHQSIPDSHRSVWRRAAESVNMLLPTPWQPKPAQSEKAQEGLSIILDGSDN